jgi:hypothetical protein
VDDRRRGRHRAGERYIFDRDAKSLSKQYQVFEKLPRQSLASMKPVRYKSSDGLEIPAYLTLPKGPAPKNLPLLGDPARRPWARDTFGYNPLAQFFANRGYAVLAPNFRGSTGYGKKFLNAGNNEWGGLMQDDITVWRQASRRAGHSPIRSASPFSAARTAATRRSPASPSRPISTRPPSPSSDRRTCSRCSTRSRRTGRRAGRCSTCGWEIRRRRREEAARAAVAAQLAAKIKTPLLVVQGRQRPAREEGRVGSDRRSRSATASSRSSTSSRPTRGTASSAPSTTWRCMRRSRSSSGSTVGTRYQESVPREVSTRLKEITVDPGHGQADEGGGPDVGDDAGAVAAAETAPATYAVTIALGAQSMKMESTNTVTEPGNTLTVTETMKTPQGEMSDASAIDKATLAVRTREIKQGPMAVTLAFEGGKATGTAAMGGPAQPISADRAVRSSPTAPPRSARRGAAAEGRLHRHVPQLRRDEAQVLAQAGEGDRDGGRHRPGRDVQGVEGRDQVRRRRAGEQTIWVDSTTRRVVKVSAALPEMGGAIATMELTK